MFQFMTNAIGLTCDPCGGPGAGQLTVFTMPNGNRLQLYYMDPVRDHIPQTATPHSADRALSTILCRVKAST